jgi:DNA-binding transcriptional ArsR family regulator
VRSRNAASPTASGSSLGLADYGILLLVLRGNLADFGLPEVFWLLSRCVKTGRLTVIVSSIPNHVYFADGRIYAVESSFSREGLGSRLVRAQKLSEEDLDRALDYCAEHGESLESVLFKWSLVDREDFDAVVHKQIREVVFLLFHMEGEEFVFESGLQVLSPRVLCDVHELIEWCATALGAMVPVLRAPHSRMASGGSILFTTDEWKLVSLVNGVRRVGEIAAELGMEQRAVFATLRSLVAAGLVTLLDGREDVGVRSLIPPRQSPLSSARPSDWRPPLPPAVIDVTDDAVSQMTL